MAEAVLIDLSAVVHTTWHATSNDPNPNATSTQALDIINRIAMAQPHVAICADSQTSLRKQEDPTYKANRPKEDRAPLYHQMGLVTDALKRDGFPIWSAEGYEADDIIASAVAQAVAAGGTARIITSDKDLLCLVSASVVVEKLDGTRFDEAAVKEKFGVSSAQMRDWLCLVGDASDNIKGAEGIGPKRATDLLTQFGSLEKLHAAWAANSNQFTPAISKGLGEFWPRVDVIRKMVELRAPKIPFEEIAAERKPMPQVVEAADLEDIMPNTPTDAAVATEPNGMGVKVAPSQPPPPVLDPVGPSAPKTQDVALVRMAPAAAPAEWEKQLEPRSMDEARVLAKFAFESKLFGAYGSPQSVLMTVMAGRDFGMSAMASLRAFHVVKGKPVLAADAIRALVMRSGKVKFFRCAERSAEKCTFIAQRHEDDAPTTLTYTMEEAKLAGLASNDNYKKNPADMLVARASSKLARLVAPEVTFGLYAPEELES